MMIYYLLPILLIAAAIAYSMWARKKITAQVANMTPEEAARRFHEYYSQYFELQPNEQMVGAWSGVEFQGASSAARQLAGAALNSASAAVIGFSTYVPTVHVGLTSSGRVLVAREHSEMGERGHFKQISAFAPGTRALPSATSHPGEDLGAPPKNPFNPMVALELIQLRAPSGQFYQAWLSPQGARVGQDGFSSILQTLG